MNPKFKKLLVPFALTIALTPPAAVIGLDSDETQGSNLSKSIAESRRPNIIYVLVDQFRAEALPNMGDPNVQAPNLQRLADEGVTMTHTYATYPLCSPNRATMFTGQYPHTNGIVGNTLPNFEGITCMADICKDNGYSTGYIGKMHLDGAGKPGFVPPGQRRHGFDFWAGFNRGHAYWDSTYFRDDSTPINMKGYEPDYQTDIAIDFINENKEKPFYLFVSYGPPHSPYYPGGNINDENFKNIDTDSIILRENVPAGKADQARKNLGGYYAHIKALDKNVGRIMDTVEQNGISEDTIIVFTADHGDMLQSQGLANKNLPFEESIHIPFIVKYPKMLGQGLNNEAMFSTVDQNPTLLSFCGLPIPESFQGVDLSSVMINNDPASGPDSVYCEGNLTAEKTWRVLRTPNYMLTVDKDAKVTKMYDMVADPFQMNNISDDPGYSEVRQQLLERLLKWQADTGDTGGVYKRTGPAVPDDE